MKILNWLKNTQREIVTATSRKPTYAEQMAIVEEIHESFDTASVRLLKEAEELIATPIDENAALMSELGFGQAKGAIDAAKQKEEIEEQKNIARLIGKYQQVYPQWRFITETEVIRICKKYNLVHGQSILYKGQIPPKNLIDIATFSKERELIKKEDRQFIYNHRWNFMERPITMITPVLTDDDFTENTTFSICAPIKDMDTRYMELDKNTMKLTPLDPVVLYPVNGGYFIVTAWGGPEASDGSVVNQKMN